MLYKFQNKIITVEDVATQLLGTEKRYRSGSEFTYSALELSNEQLQGIKQEWPPEAVKALGEKFKELKTDKAPKNKIAFDAVHSVLTQQFNNTRDPQGKFASAQLAFAMMTGTVPTIPSKNIIEFSGKKFCLKPTQRPKRVVANVSNVDDADAYILFLFDENIRRSFMIGWATASDLKATKPGNKITDKENCKWGPMSYHKPLEQIRPMAELMRKIEGRTFPEGVLFETIPDASDLPMTPPGNNLEALMDNSPSEDDGWYEMLGLEEPKTVVQEAPQKAPEAPQEQQTLSGDLPDDNWEF